MHRVVSRIKYRNVTDVFSIVSLPLLIFAFRFMTCSVADVVVSGLVVVLVCGFVGFMSYYLMTVQDLKQISGLAGDL